MLEKIQSLFMHHLKAIKNSIYALREKPLTNIITMLVIGITLTLPAIFWVVTDNLQQLRVDWQRGGAISLYLQTSLPVSDEAALLKQVRDTAGVADATLISASEGLAQLQSQEGMQDIMQYLPNNPLPAVIDVVPALNQNNLVKLEQLYQTLKSYPHVEQAKLDRQWITQIYSLLDFITQMAHILMFLLASAVVLIIGNTLRLTIQNRQEEIVVLQLIGAQHSFIARPFLYLGIGYGLGGAMFAILFVNVILVRASYLVNQFVANYQLHYQVVGLSIYQTILLMVCSLTLGWLAARLSVQSVYRDNLLCAR